MKIVIDIPKEVKEAFDKADDINFSFYDYNSTIGKAIRNGTPLPKGHGDLIDRNSILCDDCICPCGHADECFRLLAPTIIEADKED